VNSLPAIESYTR